MGKAKILIADDDKISITLLTEEFQKNGWEIIVATDGREAIKKYRDNQPDIALLDIDMPGYTGIEVTKMIRSENLQIPIILYSVLSERKLAEEGLADGVGNVYLQKPCSPSILVCNAEKFLRKEENIISLGKDISYDVNMHCLKVGERTIQMSVLEGKLFTILCRNKNRLTRRQVLIQIGWGRDNIASDETQLNKNMLRLRELIRPVPTLYIETDKRNGYWLRIKEEE